MSRFVSVWLRTVPPVIPIPWQLALWGAAGGLMVEAIEFYGAIKRTGSWPWKQRGEPGPLPLVVSVVIRIGVGLGLTWAAATTNQVVSAFGAVAVGVAAPLLLEQMAKNVAIDAYQGSNQLAGKPASRPAPAKPARKKSPVEPKGAE
jgi:hypothetical protein